MAVVRQHLKYAFLKLEEFGFCWVILVILHSICIILYRLLIVVNIYDVKFRVCLLIVLFISFVKESPLIRKPVQYAIM